MKRIFTNQYSISVINKMIMILLGVISSTIINRFLGPSLKGEYSYLLNIINILVLILNFGIYQSYPFFKRNNLDNSQNKYFAIFIVQFIIYSCIGVIFSLIIRNFQVLIILTLLPLMVLTKQLNFLALVENINLRNLLNIGNQIVYVAILIFVFIFSPVDIIYILIPLYVKDIVLVFRLINKYKLRFDFSLFDVKLMFETIKFGFFPMLSVLLTTMNYSLDTLILRYYVDFKEIGLYSVGVTLANQVWIIPDAFKDVLFSKTARSNSISSIVFSIKANFYIALFSIASITIFGKQIIYFLYGSNFVESYTVTVIIVVGLLPMILFKLLNTLFISNGKHKVSFAILFISVVLNVIANIILIPDYGINGAAFASVFSYSFCGFYFLIIFKKEFNISWKKLFIFSNSEVRNIYNKLSRRSLNES
jgi:O-antigen/teichoic acid export membrane protein